MIPTRYIEHEEFEDLIRQEEGDTLLRWQLEDFNFEPPRPDEPFDTAAPDKHVHVLFLNVAEPSLYRDRGGELLVLMPGYGDWTYSDWQDIHPNKDAWGYTVAPHGWDPTDWTHDLDDADFYYRDEYIPVFNREDVMTH